MTTTPSCVVTTATQSYPVYIGAELLASKDMWSSVKASRALVVSNSTVAPLYLDRLCATLTIPYDTLILPDGEAHKTISAFESIIDVLIEKHYRRNSCLIALGGGVITDITGFAAACYQRGVDWIAAPTSLLAQVDAAIGGKTAINHRLAKNMIGAFHHPCQVICDTRVLATLPHREWIAGLAEVVKYAIIRDSEFFDWLETHANDLSGGASACVPILDTLIQRCCAIKAEIIRDDEKDHQQRQWLNLGHTLGHALEAITHYQTYLHGEAVAIGILFASHVAHDLDLLSAPLLNRIKQLFIRLKLPVTLPSSLDISALLQAMEYDKKYNHQLRLILPTTLGSVTIAEGVDQRFLAEVVHRLQNS